MPRVIVTSVRRADDHAVAVAERAGDLGLAADAYCGAIERCANDVERGSPGGPAGGGGGLDLEYRSRVLSRVAAEQV